MQCAAVLIFQMAMEEVSQISNPSGNGAAVPCEVLLGFFLGQVRARLSFDTWVFSSPRDVLTLAEVLWGSCFGHGDHGHSDSPALCKKACGARL